VGVATAIANHNAYPPFSVQIDIRPGCGSNWVVAGGSGSVPVAVFGTATFAVSSVNVSTLALAGVLASGTSTSDVNGDGFTDLVANFPMASLPITGSTTAMTLTGAQTNSRAFSGSDLVNVVSGPGPVLTIANDGSGYSGTLPHQHHNLQTFSLSDCVTSATNQCGGALSINSIGHIVRITSDESDCDDHDEGDVHGDNDDCGGDHGSHGRCAHPDVDMVINSSSSFSLRQERMGSGDGRVYTVIFTATDSDGTTTSQCKFQVPHDSPAHPAVDSGPHACIGSGC
jgi:hypothetical protein